LLKNPCKPITSTTLVILIFNILYETGDRGLSSWR